MKIIFQLLKLSLLSLIVISSILSVTFASDNFNWNNLDVAHQYDNNGNDLEIYVSLDGISANPRGDYEVELTVNGRQLSRDLRYSSSNDELSAKLTFPNIGNSNLDNYSYIDIQVIGDSNLIVFNGTIEIRTTLSSNTTNYNNNTFNNNGYNNNSANTLYSNNINNGYNSSNNFSQSNSYSNSSYTNSSSSYNNSFSNGTNYSGNSIGLFTGINSSRLELTADYETGNKRLNFRAELKNLNLNNQYLRNDGYYRAEFTIEGDTYYTYFRYNEAIQSLVAIHSESLLSSSSLDSSYFVRLRVFENGREILEESDAIRPSTNFYRTLDHINPNQYQNTNSTYNNNVNNSINNNVNTNNSSSQFGTSSSSQTNSSAFSQTEDPISEGEILAFRYIFKIEAQTPDTTKRIETLNRVVNILESIRYSHPNPLVIDSMIITVRNRILSYH